jgi:hypothetical protein
MRNYDENLIQFGTQRSLREGDAISPLQKGTS